MPVLERTLIVEKDEHFYLVGPVSPFDPGDEELATFQFGADLKSFAPNEHLGWLRGQYVEADRPNENGALWTADELAIKSVTPRLMPVTVMHDFRTAVGMIADTKLLTPAADSVPRARIDTTLGIWKHRFGSVWEEVAENYAQGQLMQSMECRPAWYECGECDKRFPRLPGGAERANWCEHLRGETAAATGAPVRRLGNVTFTGTGLIFGTRGSRGAFDAAHLDVLADEVAEFHAKSAEPSKPKNKPRRKNTVDVDDKRYEELVAAEQRAKQLESQVADLTETAAQVPTLTSEKEALEVRAKQAEDDLKAEKEARERLEETARAETLAKERTDKLGSAFVEALPDGIKTRLMDEQAKTLADDKWAERLDELAALVKVPHDKDKEPGDGDEDERAEDEFSEDEIARSGSGNGNGSGKPPRAATQRAVVGGLLKKLPQQ